MTICAKFDGRQVRDCTRGLQNCPCLFEKMQEALRVIAYPRRGTEEEDMSAEDIVRFVEQNFTRKELGMDSSDD